MFKLLKQKRPIISPETDLLSIGAKHEISNFLESHKEYLGLKKDSDKSLAILKIIKHLESKSFKSPQGKDLQEITRYYEKFNTYFF